MSIWLHSPAVVALAWALVHFLWEGAAIAAILAVLLWVGRAWPSNWRYAAATAALFALPAAFAITAALYLQIGRAEIIRLAGNAYVPGGGPWSPGIERAAANWRAELVWLTPLWMLGVLAFYLRSVGGWIATRQLRRSGVCAAAGLRLPFPVPVLESCRIDVPLVVGILRPAILIPAGFALGLAPSQVEAILLHELAHIRRRDPLVNLLQNCIEGLLFYHPAVWWISSVVRAEREHCCDDQVVAVTGDARGYAAALAALELSRPAGQPALAANGGNLVKRIRRLLHAPAPPRTPGAPVLQALVILLVAAAAMLAWQAKPADPAPQSKSMSASAYQKWLAEDVAYIINDRERTAFLALKTDEEREHFIEQFWLRRDPTPGTVENEFKEEIYRRIAYANNRFASSVAGWKTDRGRVYILYGPPDELETHPGPAAAPPYEVWFYRGIEGSPAWCFFIGSDYRLAPAGSPLRARIPPQKPPVPNVRELPIR